MNHEQQLMAGYLDDDLTSDDESRLVEWLKADPENVREFVRETHLNRQLREAMVARVYEAAALATAKRTENRSARWGVGRFKKASTQVREVSWFHLPWTWAGVTACLAMAIGLSIWCFGPSGQPVLAEIHGAGLSLERGGRPIQAASGTGLKRGDVLRTASAVTAQISFGRENTRMTLGPGTELEVTSLSFGKRLALRLGKLEASVAPQRPFQPMILTTPQAEARVLGTRFTLSVTTNATRLDVAEGRVRFTRNSDHHYARVATGNYAVAAKAYELAALPMTGGILREFWRGVSGESLRAVERDPRYPDHPDGWDLARSFELEPVQTNKLLVRFRGYLHPPVTGDYEFWLAGASEAQLFLSSAERAEDRIVIAQASGTEARSWDAPRFQRESQWAPPLPLVAGRRYYIEGLVLIQQGEGHLSVAWKSPGRPRELLSSEFLSPAKPKK